MAKKNNKINKGKPNKKNPINKLSKKPNKNKLDKTLATTTQNQDPSIIDSDCDSSLPSSDSNSGSDSDTSDSNPEKLQKLLEPYSKDQLIDLIVNAAVNDSSLYKRILETADRDVAHRKIFVHGLGWDTTKETLTKAFESYGEIEDCNVVTDRITGKAKGYGFVLFKTRRGAVKALKQPQKKISNRVASCQLASLGPVAAPAAQGQDTAARKIYVSNVQADVDSEKLRLFFSRFGEIETGPIGFDMQTGKSRGFALFVYKTVEGARKVLEEPYKMFEGHQLHCQKAADGKNKAAAVSQPVQQPPALAAQNMMFNQPPNLTLNPMYSGFLANQIGGQVNPMVAASGMLSPGVIPSSQMGQVGASSSGNVAPNMMFNPAYNAAANRLGNLGGTHQSVLGAYGSNATSLGLQHAYPNTQLGQPSLAPAAHGTGGSFSGYSSYLR